MQVILTEEEYLKLKNQSSEDRKTYVKRIDVAIALQELFDELNKQLPQHGYFRGMDSEDNIKRLFTNFMEKLK